MLINNSNKSFRTFECHNLRPSKDNTDCLVPAEKPSCLTNDNFRPLALRGDILIVHRDNELFAIDFAANAEPSFIAQLPAAPLSAVLSTGDSEAEPADYDLQLSIMTEMGAWTAFFDGKNWQIEGLTPRWPAVALIAADAGEISDSISLDPLSVDPTTVDCLPDSDHGRINTSLKTAYHKLKIQARTAGVFIAPVFARARVVDNNGSTIHVYPPILLRPKDGDFDSPIAFDSSNRMNFASRKLSLRGFRIRAITTDSLPIPWRRRAARLVVDVSPQFMPLGINFDTEINFSREAGKDFMRVSPLPSPEGLSPAHVLNNAAVVANILPHLDSILSPSATFYDPFAAIAEHIILPRNSQPFSLSSFSSLRESSTDLPPQLACPHSFVARAAATASGSTLWGGITPLPFEGWQASCFASRFERKPWRAWVQLVAADGKRSLLWQGEGNDYAPVEFSPLLSYPLGTMASICISVEVDGNAPLSFLRTMQSTPDKRFSWSLDAELNTIVPTTSDEASAPDLPKFTLPASNDVVACASVHSPLALTVAQAIGAVPSVLLPAASSGSAWDYGRERFYVFTRHGTRLINLSADRRRISSTFLNSLSINSPKLVAEGNDCVYFTVERRLYRMQGKTARRIADKLPNQPLAIAFDKISNEIIVATESHLLHFPSDTDDSFYTTDPLNLFPSLHGIALASSGDNPESALYSLSHRQPPDKTVVTWAAQMQTSHNKTPTLRHSNPFALFDDALNLRHAKPFAPLDNKSPTPLITLPVSANSINGELRLERAYLDFSRATLCRQHIDGRIRSPLCMLLPRTIHPALNSVLSFDATVSPDFHLAPPTSSAP